jgi:hypothetical protein
VLSRHGDDIARFNPGYRPGSGADRAGFLILDGDEIVGVVLFRVDGDVARVELDYVTQRYRDFTPGEFVHRRSGIFTARGFRRVTVEPDAAQDRRYLERVGFRDDAGQWVREVVPAAG